MITDSEKCWLGGNTGLWSKPYWKRIRPGWLLIYLAKTWKTPRVEVLSYNFTRKPNTVLLCSPGKEFLLFPWFLLVPLPKLSAIWRRVRWGHHWDSRTSEQKFTFPVYDSYPRTSNVKHLEPVFSRLLPKCQTSHVSEHLLEARIQGPKALPAWPTPFFAIILQRWGTVPS